MTPYKEGQEAFKQNVPMIDCQYSKYSAQWYAWMDGWKYEWYQNLRGGTKGGRE